MLPVYVAASLWIALVLRNFYLGETDTLPSIFAMGIAALALLGALCYMDRCGIAWVFVAVPAVLLVASAIAVAVRPPPPAPPAPKPKRAPPKPVEQPAPPPAIQCPKEPCCEDLQGPIDCCPEPECPGAEPAKTESKPAPVKPEPPAVAKPPVKPSLGDYIQPVVPKCKRST